MERVEAEILGRRAKWGLPREDEATGSQGKATSPPDAAGDAEGGEKGHEDRARKARAAASRLLSTAEGAARANNEQGAWQAIHDADEEMAWTLSRVDALAEAADVRTKFLATPGAGSGAKVVEELLGALEMASDDAVRARLRKAMEVRHQYWENKYHGNAMMSGRVTLLTLGLAVALSGLVVLAGIEALSSRLESPFPAPLDQPGFFLLVLLLGYVGGSLGSILSAVGGDKILPERARDAPWHLARPLFGAAAAVLVCLVLAGKVFGVTVENEAAYLAFAGAAGFSELLLVKMMGRVEEKGSKGDDKRKPSGKNDGKGGEGGKA